MKTLRFCAALIAIGAGVMIVAPRAQSQPTYNAAFSRVEFPSGSVIDGSTYAGVQPNTVILMGTNPTVSQAFLIAKTIDNPLTNFEAGIVGWLGNVFAVNTTNGGTGVARSVSLGTPGGGWTVSGTTGDMAGGTGDNISITNNGALKFTAKFLDINTAPTIASGFGGTPTIPSANGTGAFTINVGTGGVATSGVLTLPAATTGWHVTCDDIITNTATVFVTKQTATSTTSATIGNFNTAGAAAAWVASDVLVCSARGY